MNTLVVLIAVLAAAVARPSSLEVVQSPTPDAASSMAPTATNAVPTQEANVGGVNPARTGSSLQDPVQDPLQLSGPVNPSSQYVDSPHIGLPFGTVLPDPEPMNLQQVVHTQSPAVIRIDSPHVGLPASGSAYDSSVSTPTVRHPLPTIQTSPSSSTGSFLYKFLADVHSHRISNVFLPSSFLTDGTHVFIPVNKPISNQPSSASPPVKIDSANFPSNHAYIDLHLSNPFGGFITKTPSPNFPSKTSAAVFTPSNSHGKFSYNLPVNSASSNNPTNIPQNNDSHGFPISNPISYPATNIALTIYNPAPSIPINIPTTHVPTSNPSSNLQANSAHVLLFSGNVPFGSVVNTSQGPVLVGGPSNFAIFPQQPSLDDVNQVLAAHEAALIPAATAAASPAVNPSTDTSLFPGALRPQWVSLPLADSILLQSSHIQ